jgi:hypothetical protein
MKLVADHPLVDSDIEARTLVEIASTIEAVQDGRVYVELVNLAFLRSGRSPEQYRAGSSRPHPDVFGNLLESEVPVDRRASVVGRLDRAFLQRREHSPAGSSVVLAPIAAKPRPSCHQEHAARSLKSSIERIGFLEWMMLGP